MHNKKLTTLVAMTSPYKPVFEAWFNTVFGAVRDRDDENLQMDDSICYYPATVGLCGIHPSKDSHKDLYFKTVMTIMISKPTVLVETGPLDTGKEPARYRNGNYYVRVTLTRDDDFLKTYPHPDQFVSTLYQNKDHKQVTIRQIMNVEERTRERKLSDVFKVYLAGSGHCTCNPNQCQFNMPMR